MSDVMLYGVLRMPYEMAMDDELSRYQFYQRAQQAVEELDTVRGEVVSVFSHDYPPSFRQGAPEHELEEVVTAEYCRGLVSKIVDQQAAQDTLVDAIQEYLRQNDPEGFGCACEPTSMCGPCSAYNKQQILYTALSKLKNTP